MSGPGNFMLAVPDEEVEESRSRSASRSHTQEIETRSSGAAGRMDTHEVQIPLEQEDLFVERAASRGDTTVALHMNALSTIYVARRLQLWDRLPWEVQLIFFASAVSVLTLQFMVTGLLYQFQRKEPQDKKYGQNLVCITLLYAFLIRNMSAAVQLFRLVACRCTRGRRQCWYGEGFWGVFLFLGAFYDVALHVCVLLVSMVGICSSKSIKDKLRISLAFFFLLEADEWVYAIALRNIGLLTPQDFTFQDPYFDQATAIQPAQNEKDAAHRWKLKGRRALLRVSAVITVAIISTYLYSAHG